jgi:integral membrane sensor domain MASE1
MAEVTFASRQSWLPRHLRGRPQRQSTAGREKSIANRVGDLDTVAAVALFVGIALLEASPTLTGRLVDPAGQHVGPAVAAGGATAALLIAGIRRWPKFIAAMVGGYVGAALISGTGSAPEVFESVAARSVGPLIGALIILRRKPRLDLDMANDVWWFLGAAVAIGPLVSATIGTLTSTGFDSSPGHEILGRWSNDAAGVIIVTSLLVACATGSNRRGLRSIEGLVLLATTTTIAMAVYWLSNLPIGFVLIIPIVVASARFGTSSGSLVSLLVAAVAAGSMLAGSPLWVGVDDPKAAMLLRFQLVSYCMAGLLVAVEAAQREISVRETAAGRETADVLRSVITPGLIEQGRHFYAEGVCVAADTRLDVGGDWYDVVEDDNGLVHMVIGDAVGHDEAAVAAMGRLRFALSAFASLGHGPAAVLTHMDTYVKHLPQAKYTTAWMATYDSVANSLSYSSAGHPPALLGTSDGRWTWLTGAKSSPIGIPQRDPRPNTTVTLTGSSTIILFTDGLVERSDAAFDDRLEALRAVLTESPLVTGHAIVEALTSPPRRDDTSVVRIDLRPDRVAARTGAASSRRHGAPVRVGKRPSAMLLQSRSPTRQLVSSPSSDDVIATRRDGDPDDHAVVRRRSTTTVPATAANAIVVRTTHPSVGDPANDST